MASFDVIADAAISILKPIEVEGLWLLLSIKLPWINTPFVKQFLKHFLGLAVDAQMRAGRNAAFNAYIDDYKKDAAEDAKQAVDQYNGAKNEADKKKAYEDIIADMRRVGKFVKP